MSAEPPFQTILHAEVGSTMEAARQHVQEGDKQLPFWCLAERQVAGRGRRGKPWQSPVGNFYGTVAFRAPPILPIQGWNFLHGIALYDAVVGFDHRLAEGLRLKWPNDLLLAGGKLAGVLAESDGDVVYIGTGLNILHSPDVEYRTSRLADYGITISSIELARAIHHRFFLSWHWAEQIGLPGVMKEWALRGPEEGAALTVRLQGKAVEGRYEGVDGEGRLLLKTREGLITIATGDVAY